jgi:Tfp pilus assembly protein PilN
VRPVNLLPDDLRPRRASSSATLKGSSYVLVGLLGALLVMALVYALSANQTNSRKSDIAKAQQQTQEAQRRAAVLAPYGAFAQVKATRIQSVKQLAAGRFDWERMMRELALVLPNGTWLIDMSASVGPQTSSAGGQPQQQQPPSGSGASSEESASPSLLLTGCADDQPDVAVLMVRLRKLHGSKNVELGESSQQESSGTSEAAGAASTPSAGGASSDSCPKNRFKFDVTVTFDPLQPLEDSAPKVPGSLGGGA